jgi:transcriptional regulator with XRE-family HTH domain
MDVGQKIRFLREKHGFKQINLANALQVSPQAVSKWERGANHPDIPILLKIARLFNVSTDYLLGMNDARTGVIDATVFCTSVAHFARRSISMNSKEVADYTNVLFYQLTESVLKFDGIPVKCVGDGFLCFFSGPGHANRAIQSAIHAKKVIYQKDLVITLNSGDIYLGLIGHPQYATRDIVGETVNRAFLITGWVSKHCASCIGATEAVIKRTEQSFNMHRHPGVTIELMEENVDIYEIL